ncbi:hypothetical protein HPB51_018708 [Rhipicephalus microplus]|uniref:Uncharacterized protein n=1 Tax=Rhipicephalus microplus TaxID=6941 RepID=A0A9J6DIR7_RHIMP|nr:hypothetical protein HPB51_018708 [Rhipicephalus microplus]
MRRGRGPKASGRTPLRQPWEAIDAYRGEEYSLSLSAKQMGENGAPATDAIPYRSHAAASIIHPSLLYLVHLVSLLLLNPFPGVFRLNRRTTTVEASTVPGTFDFVEDVVCSIELDPMDKQCWRCVDVYAPVCRYRGPEFTTVGALFTDDQRSSAMELAFKYAVIRINKDRNLLPNITLNFDIQHIPKGNSFRAAKMELIDERTRRRHNNVHRRDERMVVQEDPSDFCNGEKCARFCDTRSISACHRVFAMRTDYGTLRESRSGRDVQACIGAGSRCGEAVR